LHSLNAKATAFGASWLDSTCHPSSLDLSDTAITEFQGYPQLQVLILERCVSLQRLEDCAGLTALSLAYSVQLQPQVLPLCSPRLRSLSLVHWETLSDQTVADIFAVAPSLRKVDLSWCRQLTDLTIQRFHSQLSVLRVFGCPLMSLSLLNDIAAAHPTLQLFYQKTK
jgi:hypothetical protein